MRQLALRFLEDFTDPANSPEYCVRTFTDTCRGKAAELNDIRNNRNDFDEIITVTPPVITSVEMNSGSTRCTYPASAGGPQACALIIAGVEWRSRFTATNTRGGAPGTWLHVRGDAILTGVYENRQWWLCDSNFSGVTVPSTARPFLR